MAYQALDPSDLIGNLVANADLSAKQFYFVQAEKIGTALKVTLAATAGQRVLGVLQNDPAAGEACLVAGSGISKVVAEGPISVGDFVTASTAGLAITASATGYYRVGQALEAATTLGDIIAVRLANLGQNVP